ncbi:MAG: hypothetical protein ABWK04_06365 [Hydrogenobacter sp.]|uniref:hypothetical protein n=1 Tax=Hydrogenobacter thermophilus TaxID=940 RepID=UPI0030F6FE8A
MKKLFITLILSLPIFAFAGTNHPALDTLLELLTEKGVITPEEAMKVADQLRKDMDERNKDIQSMIKKALEEEKSK